MDNSAIKLATEILDIFLSNNVHQGMRYTMQQLLSIDKERSFRYTMASRYYLATASRSELWKGSCVTLVIQCPLPTLETKVGAWYPTRLVHHSVAKHFNVAGFWYAEGPDGMTFVLDSSQSGGHCVIKFVRGEPFFDEDYEATVLASVA